MLIAGLNKTTLLDYPGRVAATIFVGGCNFRCPFCHNAGLVLTPSSGETYSREDIFSFLEKRKNVLQGVCITGGEPTLYDDLPEFIREIKEKGYEVKLDTNGYRPDVLRALLQEGLLDYVAMDIKNCQEKYEQTAGTALDIEKIRESVEILKTASIPYEFRTTVVKELHTWEELLKIGEWIRGCSGYYLQQFTENDNILGRQEGIQTFHAYEEAWMKDAAVELQRVLGEQCHVQLRGID